MVQTDLGRYLLRSHILLQNITYIKQIKQKEDKSLVRQLYRYQNIYSETRMSIENM